MLLYQIYIVFRFQFFPTFDQKKFDPLFMFKMIKLNFYSTRSDNLFFFENLVISMFSFFLAFNQKKYVLLSYYFIFKLSSIELKKIFKLLVTLQFLKVCNALLQKTIFATILKKRIKFLNRKKQNVLRIQQTFFKLRIKR